MRYIPDPMVFVVGLCLGAVIAIALLLYSLYLDRQQKGKLIQKYRAVCDERHELYQILSLLQKYNAKFVNHFTYETAPRHVVEYACSPIEQAQIVYDWFDFEEVLAYVKE